jgi:hypothetical protein
MRWRGPASIVNDTPILSSERASHINKLASDSNKNLVFGPSWVLDTLSDIIMTLTLIHTVKKGTTLQNLAEFLY